LNPTIPGVGDFPLNFNGRTSVVATVTNGSLSRSDDTSGEIWFAAESHIVSSTDFSDLAGYSFAEGVDVLVTGTAFQNVSLPNNVVATLFADADVTVNGGGLLFDQNGSGPDTVKTSVTDAILDDLTEDLVESGVDEIELTDAQVSALLAANMANDPQVTQDADLSFGGGIDVYVTGTAFLNPLNNPGGPAAVNALFAGADVTVEVGNSALGQILALQSPSARDEAFDNLVSDLQAAGVDNLEFSVAQIEALAGAGVDFDASTPLGVIVQGTSFLSSNPNVATLFDSGDQITVTERLISDPPLTTPWSPEPGDVADIIGGGDTYLDTLTADLIADGMDEIVLSDAQVSALLAANMANDPQVTDLSFSGGIDVHVTGTAFLNPLNNPGGPAAVNALFAGADVTVEVGNSALGEILALGSRTAKDDAFDALVADLQAAGVDNLEFSVGQIEALADAGVDFDASTPLGVIVQGTSFLSSNASVAALFNSGNQTTVTVQLNDAQVDGFLANDSSFDSTLAELEAAGVDAVEIDVGQALQLADAGLTFNTGAGLDVVVQGTAFLGNESDSVSSLFADADTVLQRFPGGHNTPPLPPLLGAEAPGMAMAFSAQEFSTAAGDLELPGTEMPAEFAAVSQVSDEFASPAPDDVLASVDLLVDTMASAAYVDILSTGDLAQALQDVGLASGVMADNPLSDLMMVLAAAPMAPNPLEGAGERVAASGGLLDGLSGGLVSDAGDLASLLDPAALDSPHHDVGLPTAEDASALLATLAAQQGGTQVQVLGGMETAAADPFDPFQQHGKT
jgi:hypothetical protein